MVGFPKARLAAASAAVAKAVPMSMAGSETCEMVGVGGQSVASDGCLLYSGR